MNKNKTNIVVGGGISGLSFSYELAKKNKSIILVEKEKKLGGLSRSEILNNCYVDMGAHLFYGIDKEVYNKIREVVPDNFWVNVKRKGKLCVLKSFINWPFNFISIFQMPFKLIFEIALGVIEKFFKKKNVQIKNYDDVINNIYGNRLNNIFFKPLTEKFLKRGTEEISADWAIASLRAATKIKDKKYNETQKYLTEVDQSFKSSEFSLVKFFLNSILSKNNEPFFYFTEGYGTICRFFEKKLNDLNGICLKNSQINQIEISDNRILSVQINNDFYAVDNLIWTGSISSLCNILKIEKPKLNYMHSLFYYVFLNKNFKKDFDCCYFGDADIVFQRVTVNSEYSKKIIHDEKIKSVGCFELSFKSVDELNYFLKNNDELVIKDCLKLDLFQKEDLIDVKTISSYFSYPVFDHNYKNELQKFNDKIKNIKNLYTVGRQGSFSYENLDLIIRETLDHPLIKND
mgnify:CR=1 FL=1